MSNWSLSAVPESDQVPAHAPHYSVTQIVFLAILAACLSFVTVAGNVMVMISFKIDKQLQTISNYFLFSLAVADFAIGLISMPFFTMYTLLGYWPLGPHICDTWLALDYLASNASVLNLLIISFDRYFSVTRPLTYRAKRTTNRAAVMITSAWGISLLLWPPWIYSWPHLEGKRTVPEGECYIQFIETNHYITFGTAIAAFYVPVTVMCFLYWRIWRETKKRQKDLPNLQAGKKDSSKRSNSSDEAMDLEDWKKTRGESGGSGGKSNAVKADGAAKGSTSYLANTHNTPNQKGGNRQCLGGLGEWCREWWHSGREEPEPDLEDTPSDMGYATPVSIETPLQSSVSRCTSLNVIRDPYAAGGGIPTTPRLASHHHPTGQHFDSRTLPATNRLTIHNRSLSQDSVYTILIRLPPDPSCDGATEQPSIKMISEESATPVKTVGVGRGRPEDYSIGLHPGGYPATRRPSHISDIRIPLNAKIIPKQLTQVPAPKSQPPPKKKKKTQEKKADKKAAKTLSAILLTFIITWTPYNILVLLKPLTHCENCIPQGLWDFFYYLCYINSTINPMCYALCNASFRRTYVRILTCKWKNRKRTAMNRGFYN